MRRKPRNQHRAETLALLISVLWMLVIQIACVAVWDVGGLTRKGAMVTWMILGVLPPALALWGMGTRETDRS